MHYCTATLLVLLFSPLALAAQEPAQDEPSQNNNSLEKQKLKLEVLRKSLNQASQQRNEHSTRLESLKHRLDCNWSLIQAYESCEARLQNDPKGQLRCKQQAKRDAAACLGEN
jgi:hypothetical protein